jgi:hypothetical protein
VFEKIINKRITRKIFSTIGLCATLTICSTPQIFAAEEMGDITEQLNGTLQPLCSLVITQELFGTNAIENAFLEVFHVICEIAFANQDQYSEIQTWLTSGDNRNEIKKIVAALKQHSKQVCETMFATDEFTSCSQDKLREALNGYSSRIWFDKDSSYRSIYKKHDYNDFKLHNHIALKLSSQLLRNRMNALSSILKPDRTFESAEQLQRKAMRLATIKVAATRVGAATVIVGSIAAARLFR